MFRRKRRHRGIFLLLIVFVILTAFVLIFEFRFTPVITAMAQSRAGNIATETVNNAVRKVLCEKNLTYESLVHLTRDSEGNVTSVTVDSVKTNKLCAEIRGEIVEDLSALGEKNVSIPIGNLTGMDIFTGRGPRLTFVISLSGSASTDIVNEFHTAGINQTRHLMILNVKTKIYIIMQSGNITAETENSIVIAETVIVGKVPEIYSDGNEDLWENLI